MSGAATLSVSPAPVEARLLPSPFWARQLSAMQESWAYRLWLRRQKPVKVALLPTDPWPGDAAHGADLVEGWLSVGQKRFPFTEQSWNDPQGALPASVHTFGWLRDLHAVGGTRARIVTRRLTEAWLARHGERPDAAWDPCLCGQRLANWLMHYSFFGASASDEFCEALHASMIRQMHVLRHRFAALRNGRSRFSVLFGLAFATGCLRGFGELFEAVLHQVTHELVRQLDDEGAHRSASPQVHFDILRDLIALRGLCHVRQREVPQALHDAISVMAGVVRFLRLGDGSLPLFHGTRTLSRSCIDQVLSLTGGQRAAGPGLTVMGFHRVARGPAILILDGVRPTQETFGCYHASALAFEMSIGKQKLITSCGWPLLPEPAWQEALRSTPAHSTLTVNGMSSATFEDDLFPLQQRLTEVTVTREGSVLQAGLEASHNGFVPPFGVRHRRRLSCDEQGTLTGEDILEGEPGQEVVIRFHLAPQLRAVVEASKRKVYIDLPNKDIWAIQATSGTIALEDSLCFGENGERLKTVQVVLTGTTDAYTTVYKWVVGKV